MTYQIKQLKLGGILDQAIAITKNHFGLLFSIMLVLWVPYQLISGLYLQSIMPVLPPNPTVDDILLFNQQAVAKLPATMLVVWAGILLILPVTNAAVIYAISRKYLGQEVSPLEAIQKGVSKIVPLVWTMFLMMLAIMGGLILLIIPGILCALWFGLAQHVVVLEDTNGFKALSRSKLLVRPFLGTFLMLGIVIGVIGWMLGSAGQFIPQQQVQLVVVTLIQAGITLVSAAAFVVFYFSCRCAADNFDLEHLAASVSAGVPAATSDEV
ncbi:MAG: hypothetical protein R3C12_14920 [Planctomycetaceae bacterium]|nr:hypothetical protein [Planctomycetaceae bacterium]